MTLPVCTRRLVVREYTMADLDDVLAVIGDPRVFWWRAEPFDRVGVRSWLQEEMALVRAQGIGRYAVQLRDVAEGPPALRGRVIGGVSLLPRLVHGRPEVEIGWHVRADLWRRGYATEAAGALMEEARERGLSHLVAFIVPTNSASAGVAAKLGLSVAGEIDWAGQPHDLWAIDLA